MKKPILFLVFNRPSTTLKVFEQIKLYKPKRLYIAADGPRPDKEGELKLCEEVRAIADLVDWECELKTNFRTENLGCKIAVSSAIDWFFEFEEDGIILEDDVVPSYDFFDFCTYNLEKYRSDERVMMITGTNYLSQPDYPDTYFFSRHFTIWGWATWKRAWQYYDVNMQGWSDENLVNNIRYEFSNNFIWRHFKNTFNSLSSTYINTWDIQWVFTCIANSGLCITPKVNLISNIGVEGTHGDQITDSHFLETYQLNTKESIIDPRYIIPNANYDYRLHKIKSLKSNRRNNVIKLLKFLYLYNVLRTIVKKIKLFR